MVSTRSSTPTEFLNARAPGDSSKIGSFAARNNGSVSKMREMITPLQRYVPLDPFSPSLFDRAFHADGLFGSEEDKWGVLS